MDKTTYSIRIERVQQPKFNNNPPTKSKRSNTENYRSSKNSKSLAKTQNKVLFADRSNVPPNQDTVDQLLKLAIVHHEKVLKSKTFLGVLQNQVDNKKRIGLKVNQLGMSSQRDFGLQSPLILTQPLLKMPFSQNQNLKTQSTPMSGQITQLDPLEIARRFRNVTLINKVFASFQRIKFFKKNQKTLMAATHKAYEINLKKSFEQLNLDLDNLQRQNSSGSIAQHDQSSSNGYSDIRQNSLTRVLISRAHKAKVSEFKMPTNEEKDQGFFEYCLRDLQQKRNRKLLVKIFTFLRSWATQLKEFRTTKLKKLVFFRLKKIFKLTSSHALLKQKHNQFLKRKIFRRWVQHKKQYLLASQNKHDQLKLKVLRSLWMFRCQIVTERNAQIFFNRRLMIKSIKVWKIFLLSQKRKNHRLTVLSYKMNQMRKKQTLKSWFNKINLIDRQVNIGVKQPKITVQEFRVRNYQNFLKKFFKPWLLSSQRKQQKKLKFYTLRALSINRITFNCWKKFTQERAEKNKTVLKIYKIRAAYLQAQAFSRLLKYHRIQSKKNKLNKIADYKLAIRLLKVSLKSFKKFKKQNLVFIKVSASHNWITACKFLKEWKDLKILQTRLNRATHRRSVTTKIDVFSKLKFICKVRKIQSLKLNEGLQLYKRRLLFHAIKSVQKYTNYRIQKAEILSQSLFYYTKRTLQIAFNAFSWYKSRTQMRRNALVNHFEQKKQDLKQKILNVWNMRVDKNRKKLIGLPLLRKIRERTKFNCLIALRKVTFQSMTQRSVITSVCELKDQRMMQNVFDVIDLHKQHQQWKQSLVDKAQSFRNFNLQKTALKSFLVKQIQTSKDQARFVMVQQQARFAVFIKWYNWVHAEIPRQNDADKQYKRFRFQTWADYSKAMQPVRQQKKLLAQLQQDYFFKSQVEKSLKYMFFYSQAQIQKRNRQNMSSKIWVSKLFQHWHAVTPLLKQKNRRNKIIIQLQKKTMKSLAFKSLQTNVETNFRNKKIIQLLQEKRKVDLLRNCIVSLYESAKNTQVKFQKFVDRITPTVYKSLSKVLYRWGEFVNHQAKQDVAELFRRQRHLRRLQRLVFDGIQVYAVKQRSKNIKKKLETAHYLTNLLRTSVTKLQLNSQRRLRLKIIHGIILKKNLHNLKYAIVSSLVQKMRSSQQRNNCYDVLANKNKINLLRKCFQGFQKYETLQIKSKLIQRRNQGLLVSQILQTWYIQSVKASKISNMVALLQTQYELRLMWQVLPNLKEIGWHLQQSVQMRFKQSQNLKLKCLRALKSQILLKQISKAFYDKILIRKKSQVIQSLRNYVLAKVMHRQAVDEQINIQDQEDKLILLKTCWQRLLELGFKHRAVRCARHKYVQSLLTTAIKQMRIFKFKMNWLKDKELRIQTDICHKMFKLWRSTQMNNQHELAARKVLSYPQMAKIIKQWQFVTQVWKAARLFRARWADRRLKFLTVRGLQQNTVVTQFQNMVQQRIQQQRRITLLKTGLNLFQQGLQAVKVNEQLDGLYLYNLKRVALTKLKERVHQQNKHRLALVKIRYAFQLNPRLKRPLIIIKNLLLYRTFQRLKKNCLRHSRAVKSKKISLYAQYLRLLRKSFYALRLNAANKFQEKKSREIQNLLVQRRWFNNLKRACDQRKALRKMRTDAAIFRFLKLQMKALKSIVLWFTEMKKLEVQSNFAVALYYKQLLKRGLFSLQIYRVLRKEQRCAPQIQNSYADLPCKPFDRINDENRRTNSDEIAGFFGQRSSYDIQNVSLALSDSKKYFNQETVTLGQTQQNIIKSPAEKASQEFLLSNVELGPMSPNTHSGYKKLPKTILMSLKRSSNSSYTNKVNSNDSKL